MSSPSRSVTNAESRQSITWGRKQEVIYFCQIGVIFTVIVACIINLSLGTGHESLWSSMLSGVIGYILPAPKIRKRKNVGGGVETNKEVAEEEEEYYGQGTVVDDDFDDDDDDDNDVDGASTKANAGSLMLDTTASVWELNSSSPCPPTPVPNTTLPTL